MGDEESDPTLMEFLGAEMKKEFIQISFLMSKQPSVGWMDAACFVFAQVVSENLLK